MPREKATPRSCGYGGVKSTEQVDEQSIARRTEQGGLILAIAVVLMMAVPMVMEAVGL